jgi:multidrug efflux pump subunit AcrA (membrane-fusion protein)
MRAEVDINESDIAKLFLGTPAVVVPDAYPEARFDARLVKIYPEADRQKATVRVEVQIVEPNLAMIKPEMRVKADFLKKRISGKEQSHLIVPTKAIEHEGSESYVWTIRDGTARRVSVVKGSETQSGVEVRQGLQDGDPDRRAAGQSCERLPGAACSSLRRPENRPVFGQRIS